jgi:hypothetical protein
MLALRIKETLEWKLLKLKVEEREVEKTTWADGKKKKKHHFEVLR